MSNLGLLAGKGELPLEFLKSAKEKGYSVTVFALEGITSPFVEEYAGNVFWIKPFKLGKFLSLLKKSEIKNLAILGKVEHRNALSLTGFDFKALSFILSLKDRKPETIIRGIIEEIEKAGVKVIDPTPFLSHLLQPSGVLVGDLEESLKRDMELGMKVAKEIASLDVGQTVVVKDGTVIAVEGIEGTDECIKRGAELSGGGFVVCKAARRRQDMRIDVPTIGKNTVELIGKLGGKALIFEAEKTYLLDKEKIINSAKNFGVTVVGV